MNKLGRKLLVASLCACMAAASLTGCGSKAGKAAVTVGDDTASLGLVNLMLRFNQAQMQSLYASFMGDNMWETYGETTKSNIVESLENMFLMEIKINKAVPIWFTKILSEYDIYPVSFSKYGTEYKQYIMENLKRKDEFVCLNQFLQQQQTIQSVLAHQC